MTIGGCLTNSSDCPRLTGTTRVKRCSYYRRLLVRFFRRNSSTIATDTTGRGVVRAAGRAIRPRRPSIPIAPSMPRRPSGRRARTIGAGIGGRRTDKAGASMGDPGATSDGRLFY